MKLLLTLIWFPLCGIISHSSFAATPPNIIFILADDLGLDGVGCYGSDKHKTPNIDRLAASGTRFETCYSAPICGPSRYLLMTGRYAFRTGGLSNLSFRKGGPGAGSKDEWSIAKVLQQSGYATGHAGKWGQLRDNPRDWGFDEYTVCNDPAEGGWVWKDGTKDSYNPDIMQAFCIEFINRHKSEPFFLYYPTHFVHTPILRTPDSKRGSELYQDNIAYMDKQVGAIIAEVEKLGLREKTLIIFSGDNGTHVKSTCPIGGRKINGRKASLLEGGSRVPYIASWPGTTPAGKVSKDIVSFADQLPTLAEIGGAKLPEGVKIDGISLAPQLRGEKGTPRQWAYVQLGAKWFVREQGWKLNESGELFDMSDAPFVEKPVTATADTDASKAARARLTAVLAELNPAAGKTESVAARTAEERKQQAERKKKTGK